MSGVEASTDTVKRIIAALVLGIAIGFIVGHLSAGKAEAAFDPHDPAQCSAYDGSEIYNNVSVCRHHDTHVIAVRYEPNTYGADYLQLISEVLAEWSIPDVFAASLAGEAPAGACDLNAQPWVRGVVYLCDGLDEYNRWGYEFGIDFTQPYPYVHYAGGRMWLKQLAEPYNNRGVACHEFGHLWGLNHGALDPDEGCMDWKSNAPGPFALQKLAELMEHLEGGVPLPTATATRTATPTVTPIPTANPTPTTYPGPSCWPPKAKRCR